MCGVHVCVSVHAYLSVSTREKKTESAKLRINIKFPQKFAVKRHRDR